MKVYVLISKFDNIEAIEGVYSSEENLRKAFEDLLREKVYDGFSEFCSEDEEWGGNLNPWQMPINETSLEDVLESLYYENDAGEWVSSVERQMDA